MAAEPAVETKAQKDERERSKREIYMRRALIIWIILFTAAVGYSIRSLRENSEAQRKSSVEVKNLVKQNKERISEIQQSRLESCKANYQSFHAVFDPFFPPKNKRTPEQKENFVKFDKIIADKIKHCRAQVSPPPVTKKKGTQ